jgi:ABC-2 type transport system ATP-binding protein
MSEMAIATQELCQTYDELQAVNRVNLHVPRGSIYGFLGRNGAGKSTTIKILLGLARATSGTACMLGMEVGRERLAILQRTAYVAERKVLQSNFTATELIRYSRGYYPMWSDELAEKYARLFEVPMKREFKKLSQGNQTKVWLVLALAQCADLLILDEPTVGLDPVVTEQLLRLLSTDVIGRGCTVFFSSHQLSEVEQIAEWVGVLDRGAIQMEARLDDIKANYRLVIAAGNALPKQTSQQVLSVVSNNDSCRYIVACDAEQFASTLKQNGAQVLEVVPLSLRDIFLHLVRMEDPRATFNVDSSTM